MVINIMAQRAFTIMMPDQVKALMTSFADDTAKTEFSTSLKAALIEYAKREAANRRGGRKPAKLFFVGNADVNPIFDRDFDGKTIVPQTEEDWKKVRFSVTYPYSTKKDGKKVGEFFSGALFKEDAEGLSGQGTVQKVMHLWECAEERQGMTNEQAVKATMDLLKSFEEVTCETVVVGKTANGGDKFGYNLSSPKAEEWLNKHFPDWKNS